MVSRYFGVCCPLRVYKIEWLSPDWHTRHRKSDHRSWVEKRGKGCLGVPFKSHVYGLGSERYLSVCVRYLTLTKLLGFRIIKVPSMFDQENSLWPWTLTLKPFYFLGRGREDLNLPKRRTPPKTHHFDSAKKYTVLTISWCFSVLSNRRATIP